MGVSPAWPPVVEVGDGIARVYGLANVMYQEMLEFEDQRPFYDWLLERLAALGLLARPLPRQYEFARLNLTYVITSKRKLKQLVDEGIVSGWDDPRFPTVRGIRRRGLTVEALRQFMISQGPSQNIVSLEWDTLWTLNKKVIDPVAPRFWALTKQDL